MADKTLENGDMDFRSDKERIGHGDTERRMKISKTARSAKAGHGDYSSKV
jgi:hypothetical protein